MKKLLTLFAFLILGVHFLQSQVVILEIYGAGGNSGATWRDDVVILQNNGGTDLNFNSAYSLQYASAAGSSWSVTTLTGTILAGGKYYLKLASGGSNGSNSYPFTFDQTNTAVNLSATTGKLALASQTTALSGTCPTTNIVDFVGYGATANCNEGGTNAPAPSATTSIRRDNSGTDTNVNGTDFTVNSTPLPLHLTTFYAQNKENMVEMNWKTATEQNVSHFSIERSADSKNWESIGQVRAAGNSLEEKNYSFDDLRPLAKSFYRLRTVDFDGKESISKIVPVVRSQNGTAVSIYPNPTTDGSATLFVETNDDHDADLTIFDLAGRAVLTQKIMLTKGENRLPVDLSALPKGIFTASIFGSEPVRFVKQ